MARNADPLRRADIIQQARGPEVAYTPPRTNSALQLSASLADLNPTAQASVEAVAGQLKAKYTAKAKKDVLQTQGIALADAQRQGLIKGTDNPWYVQAYRRESAAVRVQDQLQDLQMESASWSEKTDPDAFAKKWRESVAAIAGNYEGIDEVAGIEPVEAQFTQQVLQSNSSLNIKRIQDERMQNLSALSASSLADMARANGGILSPNQAFAALEPARAQWFATGGSQDDWNNMVVETLITAARSTNNPDLLDLAKSPELLAGISEFGNETIGDDEDIPDENLLGAPSLEIGPQRLEPTTVPSQGQRATSSKLLQVARMAIPGLSANSLTRSKKKNMAVGGKDNSQHMDRDGDGEGTAMDIPPQKGISRATLKAHYAKQGFEVDIIDEGDHWHIQGARNPRGLPMAGQNTPGFTLTGNSLAEVAAASNSEQGKPQTAPPPIGTSLVPLPANIQRQGINPLKPSRGPSLYDQAGIASKLESERYYIQQQVENQQTERVKQMATARKVAGVEASDRLWATHGTQILTGNYNERELIAELTQAGYTPQVVGEALSNIRGAVGDSVALQSARYQLRGGDTEVATKIININRRARTEGYTPELESELEDMVLAGDIDGGEAERLIGNAISTQTRLTNEAEADARREDKTKNKGSGVKASKNIKEESLNLAILVRRQFQAKGWPVVEDADERIQKVVLESMRAHLGANPGDYAGAYDRGRARAAQFFTDYGNNIAGQAK